MAALVQEVMARNPRSVPLTATTAQVAQIMRDDGIGSVVVLDGDHVLGLVTDRDIVVRAVASERDPTAIAISEICSTELVFVRSDDTIDNAAELMRAHALRRLPVIDDKDQLVGMVSLGDLAMHRDQHSALAEISGQKPNN